MQKINEIFQNNRSCDIEIEKRSSVDVYLIKIIFVIYKIKSHFTRIKIKKIMFFYLRQIF